MKIVLLFAAALGLAYGFDQEEKETITKNFPAATRLEIDNVHGYIHVTGYNGADVQMTAEKRIVAESAERLEAAKREVKLDTTQSGDTLTFYVDGPFRCNCDDNRRGVNETRHRGYRVIYDFDVKVPTQMAVRLATVNGGEVRVSNITGDFDVSNVNGSVEVEDMAGSGSVHTVNGKINASFTRSPQKDCSFRTVNGTVEASFPPNLNADVRVKTFNGHAYTDFPVSALPPAPPVSERRDGKFIYRSDQFTGMRIGSGGPEFKFNTLNGTIRIINRGK